MPLILQDNAIYLLPELEIVPVDIMNILELEDESQNEMISENEDEEEIS